MILVRRVYVEKRPGFDVESKRLQKELRSVLGLEGLEDVRILVRYDVENLPEQDFDKAVRMVFSDPAIDQVTDEVTHGEGYLRFATEFLPGQYDQRSDVAAQCVQMLTLGNPPLIHAATVYLLKGLDEADLPRVKEYCINPVEAREAGWDKPESLEVTLDAPEKIAALEDFLSEDEAALEARVKNMGLAMTVKDLAFVQRYFRDDEKRAPSMTELRVIDTYWSDHCRHTTFLTHLENIKIEKGAWTAPIERSYEEYCAARNVLYAGRTDKPVTLMDMATIAAKELRRQGLLDDLDESEEINACSIVVPVDVDGETVEYLVMFKNETHNHPTEIEPFGGAATCLGGAIRDPLSGRSYVYQAMRITGAADPRQSLKDTMPGKLPQRVLVRTAAQGYSSYGNQIGLATGKVEEIYHPGYVAKHMELGAVIGAAPRENVVRERPVPGDQIVLLGGRTGRDGCGGATGSSKAHTEESLTTCGAEVQKGNPLTERKIQRLFRKKEVSRLIKRCNDFGAGGVCVAIGELAESLDINLDAVPKKYEGLDGTELAISESQERMAVVLDAGDVQKFLDYAQEENLEATLVATVTPGRRLRMFWNEDCIVDISRDFLDTNGAPQQADATVTVPCGVPFFDREIEVLKNNGGDRAAAWKENLAGLNVCSQKGLAERFDASIGAGTVLMPFGGKYQLTPNEAMAAKIPLLEGETDTATLMAHGYDPDLSSYSPYHGAMYAVIHSLAKIACAGGDYAKARLTMQEYFQRMTEDPTGWGKPMAALLGAYEAQKRMGTPGIGGKDSMSGTFNDVSVPPTLVSIAVGIAKASQIGSPEFKQAGGAVALLPVLPGADGMIDFEALKANLERVGQLVRQGQVQAAATVGQGGAAATVSKMAFGNHIGFELADGVDDKALFMPYYGSVVLAFAPGADVEQALKGLDWRILGQTIDAQEIRLEGQTLALEDCIAAWTQTLERVYPTDAAPLTDVMVDKLYTGRPAILHASGKAQPRVVIPAFPGTNCEEDTARAFRKAGAVADIIVLKNLTPAMIEDSIATLEKAIRGAQILMLPGGFSGGDEPDGSGKFIATTLRNPRVKDAVMELLQKRDGLALGICNGFQALMKLGLLPYGEIREIDADCPTLTYNTIGRHASCMVRTRIASVKSPWLTYVEAGDIHAIPVSHGEGRFVGPEGLIRQLFENGQVATQYVDLAGNPTMDSAFNPNGAMAAIEGILSPDGRVMGKMGHSERIGANVVRNVPGEKDQKLFKAGVDYFR